MQLLLKYGVDASSADPGLLQRLAYTGDMAAVALLDSHGLNLASATLTDGRSLLHLLVSFCPHKQTQYSSQQTMIEKEAADTLEHRSKEIKPLVERLLTAGASCCLRDSEDKTVLDVCLPGFTGLKALMHNTCWHKLLQQAEE